MKKYKKQSAVKKMFFLALMITVQIFLIVSARFSLYAQSSPAQNKIVFDTLKVGKVVSKKLKGGGKDIFFLDLEKDQYVKTVIEQKGIDVVVKLYDPEGTEIVEIDSPTEAEGPELIEVVTENRGRYKIEVISFDKEAPLGNYEISLLEQRSAETTEREQIKLLLKARKLTKEAFSLQEESKYEQAEALHKEVLSIRTVTLGINHPDTASSFANLAEICLLQNRHEEAEAFSKKSLEINKEVFGLKHPSVSSSLISLATIYEESGKYREAEQSIKEALEIDEQVLAADHPDTAYVLNRLGYLSALQGKNREAEEYYKNSLAMNEKVFGTNHPAVASNFNGLGYVYYLQARYQEAEEYYKKALTINEKVFGNVHPRISTDLNDIALLYCRQGRYTEAEPLYIKSLEVAEKVWGANLNTAICITNLAGLYESQGRYAEAEPLYKRCLDIREMALGVNHPEVAHSLSVIAGLYESQGRYAEAEPLYKRCLEIKEQVFGLANPSTAISMDNLALLYFSQGRYTEAELLSKKSLEIIEQSLGLDHPTTATNLNNLALIYLSQDKYREAEALYKKSLEINEKVFGVEHPNIAITIDNLAYTYLLQSKYREAELLYKRSLQINEKILGIDHPITASSIHDLALLYTKQGKYEEAEVLYNKSLKVKEKILGLSHPSTAATLNDFSNLYLLKAENQKALEYRIKANDVREREYLRNLIAGSEKQKLLYLKKTAFEFDQTISLHLQVLPQDKQAAVAAMTAVLRKKGRALDAIVSSIEILRKKARPEDKELLGKLADAKTLLSTITLKGEREIEKYQEKIKKVEQMVEELEAKVSEKSIEYKAQIQEVYLDSIREAVPQNSVLVEYLLYYPYDAKQNRYGSSHYAVYILSRNGGLKWMDLGEAEEIDRLATEFRKKLREKKNGKVLSQKLYEVVIEPVIREVGKKDRLLLSPDGALNLIPFAALEDKAGKYLIEKYKVSYLTSGRDLLRLHIKAAKQGKISIFANPDYGQGKRLVLTGISFKPLRRLPETMEEGRSIKRLFQQAELRTGKLATEEKIKQVSRPEILHIATHGYFLEDAKQQYTEVASRIARSIVREEGKEINLEKEKSTNPLLRSYLFFAKVNSKGSRIDDGTLTALEAASLDLRGTKLVVLSACDTGVGEVKNGEGVYGLRRALVLAGSESQMISLWQVSDRATKELMLEYYRRLKRGEGRSDALQNVQLKMLQKKTHKHPYYWAGFIQSGKWTSLQSKE